RVKNYFPEACCAAQKERTRCGFSGLKRSNCDHASRDSNTRFALIHPRSSVIIRGNPRSKNLCRERLLQLLVEQLAELRDLRRDDELTVRLRAVQLEVFLMVVLGLVELPQRLDLRDDLAVPLAARRRLGNRLVDRRLLLRVAIERD